jgi:predicted metal-binding transcription factor (methanogenesis marker protein 9)
MLLKLKNLFIYLIQNFNKCYIIKRLQKSEMSASAKNTCLLQNSATTNTGLAQILRTRYSSLVCSKTNRPTPQRDSAQEINKFGFNL